LFFHVRPAGQELFDPTVYPDFLYYDKLRTLPAGRRVQEVSKTGDGAAVKRPLVHVVVGGSAQGARQGAADAATAAAAIVASRLADGVSRKKIKWDSSKQVSKSSFTADLGGAAPLLVSPVGAACNPPFQQRPITTVCCQQEPSEFCVIIYKHAFVYTTQYLSISIHLFILLCIASIFIDTYIYLYLCMYVYISICTFICISTCLF